MTLKRAFWWGKLTGLLAGGMVGASGGSKSVYEQPNQLPLVRTSDKPRFISMLARSAPLQVLQ